MVQSCLAGLGCHGWDAPTTPRSVGWLALHTGAGQCSSGRFSDTMRWVYRAVACRDWLPRFGTLRRYHPSGWFGAAAQMGRSGDTMVCGLACTRVFVVNIGLGCDGRDASAIPTVWVGVYPVVGLDTTR